MPPFYFLKCTNMAGYISTYCTVSRHQIWVNGKTVFEEEGTEKEVDEFLIAAHRHFKIKYPKFYKMDVLSRLAFIASEMLLSTDTLKNDSVNSQTSIILCNRSSTVVTDVKHQKNIQKEQGGIPSPATFVYTLPNIMIGEMSIRHRLTGESVLFISETFPVNAVVQYSNFMIDQGICNSCLCGWVEVSLNYYHAFLYVVKSEEKLVKRTIYPHTSETIQKLYLSNH